METKAERLLSLDVFRGITIVAMILVNNQGDWNHVYPVLDHALWHGFTPTDAIFPFFLFMVGVTTTISLNRRKLNGDYKTKLLGKIFFRSFLLVALGIIKDNYPFYSLSNLQFLGVLQRIGLVYFFTSLIFLKTSYRSQLILNIVLLIGYWGLMTLIPVPGVGYPNLEVNTNLAAYLDRLLLAGHLYVKTVTWDPSGLLSTLPAISSALFGVHLGHWMLTKKDEKEKTIGMFIAGNILIVLGLIWDSAFPINKNLWTSSYVIYSTGLALNCFALCYWIVDIKKYCWWTKPFLIYGMNALFVYFISGIFGRTIKKLIFISVSNEKSLNLKDYLFQTFVNPHFTSPYNASVVWALLMIAFWFFILWVLYRKNIFIKV
jgi:predicted acyltransferase